MKTKDVQALYNEFVISSYTRTPLVITKGKGSRVWDLEGREFIDFFPGWGVSGLGHCHPEVVSAIREQARKMLHVSNNFYHVKQALLAEEISNHAFPARVFFCNSGAEASEAAVKFARKYGKETGRYEIVSMRKSFHGRTLAGIAVTGQEKVQKGFEPLPQGFQYAELNNLESVRKALTEKTVAIFLEPVQGEGGINVASQEFMKGLRKLCHEKDMLLILDEVQTGMGRTGKMFGYQHYGLEPDLMTLAKSLGGGVPIGALVVNRKIKKDVFTPGTHGSTYGGNPLVTAAGLAVFKAIRKEKLLEKAVQTGNYLGEKLEALKRKFPQLVVETRGLAMMRAIQLSVPGAPVVERALKAGLLVNCTQDTVLRIMPAINIPRKVLKKGLQILEDALRVEASNQKG